MPLKKQADITNMETINGISFEDWAAACGNLAQGMPETEVIRILAIELPVWQAANEQWGKKLGDLMTEDMGIATTYGEIFANPKVSKFANVDSPVVTIDELLKIVPDYETYQKILWHQSIASTHGIDPSSIIEGYGLDTGKWGSLNMHYSNDGINSLNPNAPDYNHQFQYYSQLMKKWKEHWKNHYKDYTVDLSGDIDF